MFLILGASALIVFLVVFYLYRRRNVTFWDSRGVPTAKGCHWFFGHYKDILQATKHFGLMFDDIYNDFPEAPYVGYLKMSEPGLLIKDPDLIKAVLQTDFSSFAKNDVHVDEKVDFLFGNNPFSRWGEGWKTSRGHTTPHFTYLKLKNYCPVVLAVADEMVKHVTERCEASSGVASFEAKSVRSSSKAKDKSAVVIRILAEMFTTDAVANALCGVQNNTFADPNSLFATVCLDIFGTGTFWENLRFMLVFLFPEVNAYIGMRFTPKRTENLLLTLTRNILRERMESKETRSDIFQEVINQIENGKADVFTDEYIASQMYACILDGYETSSIAISYVLFELAWHSDVQEKLRSEIKAMVDRTKGNYTIDDVEGLKYLDMVLCETLRLHAPLLVMSKQCTADYTIPDQSLTIEKGTIIAIAVNSIHRDPKFYPEPQRFDPERFTNDEMAKRHKFVYLPFGEGPRKCLGQRFGVLQSKIAVMKLVEHFQIIPSPKTGYQIEVDPKVFLLRHALNGAWIQMRKLS